MTAIPNIPDNVVYLKIKGALDSEAIKSAVREIEAKLSRHDKIGIVSDLTGFEGVTLDGFLEDMRQNLNYLGKWHLFPHLAIIAKDGMLKSFAETAAGILPQVELRVFAPSQVSQAIDFAAETGERDAPSRTR
jgi:hypothetical protein